MDSIRHGWNTAFLTVSIKLYDFFSSLNRNKLYWKVRSISVIKETEDIVRWINLFRILAALKDSYWQAHVWLGALAVICLLSALLLPDLTTCWPLLFMFVEIQSQSYSRPCVSTLWEVTLIGDSLKGNSLDHFVQHLFVSHGNCGLEDKQWDWLSTRYYIITEGAAFSLKLLEIRASSFPKALLLLEGCHLRFHTELPSGIPPFIQCMFLIYLFLHGAFTCVLSFLYCLGFELHMGLIDLSCLFKLIKLSSCSGCWQLSQLHSWIRKWITYL